MCNLSQGVFDRGVQKGIQQGLQKGIQQGRQEGKQEERLDLLRNLMHNGNLPLEQAAMLLGIPADEQETYRKLLNA